MPRENEIREYLGALFRERAERKGLSPQAVDDGENLLAQGLVDSMAFLEIAAAAELRFGVTLDLAGIDPMAFPTLRGLARALDAARPTKEAK